jgi:hypothetical protein
MGWLLDVRERRMVIVVGAETDGSALRKTGEVSAVRNETGLGNGCLETGAWHTLHSCLDDIQWMHDQCRDHAGAQAGHGLDDGGR